MVFGLVDSGKENGGDDYVVSLVCLVILLIDCN